MTITPSNYEHLSPHGDLDSVLGRSIAHLLEIPKERLFADFNRKPGSWAYGGDFVSRWLDGFAHYQRMPDYRDLDSGILDVAERIIAFQSPDGFFGKNYIVNEYTGTLQVAEALLGVYDTFSYQPALESAGRALDFFYEYVLPVGRGTIEPEADPFAAPVKRQRTKILPDAAVPMIFGYRYFYGIQAFSRYFEITGDRRGLDYVSNVFSECDVFGPCDDYERITGNLHVLIHIYRGLLAFGHCTQDAEVLAKVVEFWEWVKETKSWISGGIQEWLIATTSSETTIEDNDALFYTGEKQGRDKIDETCTVSDWMMLGFDLYRATGESRFLDTGERTFVDHHRFDFAANGGWCGHRGLWGDTGSVWDCCCSHHGPRCLVDALRYAAVSVDEEAVVNLYVPVETRVETKTGVAHVTIDPEADGSGATITFGEQTRGEFSLRLRCPEWSDGLRVDGQTATRGSHLSVAEKWAPGRSIRVHFDARNELQICTRGPGICIGSAGRAVAALRHGPYTYALRDADVGDFGLTSERVRIERSSNPEFQKLHLSVPEAVDTLITHHDGAPTLTFRIFVDDELVYAGERRSFVEVPLTGASEVILETSSGSSDVSPALGRWHNCRVLTADGNITFLDTTSPNGGDQFLRRIYFREETKASEWHPDGSVTADIHDDVGTAQSVRLVPLVQIENELEDPNYDLGGTVLPFLKPVAFRAMLPLLE